MELNRQNGASGLLLGAVLLVVGTSARADEGPPIKINMPADTLAAESGVEYHGVFIVDVREAGTLSEFEIHGEGWTILDVDVASDSVWASEGEFRIPFRAVPTDADQRITMTLRYDGRKVTRSLRIGPAAFAQRGKDRASVRVESVPQKTTPPSPPPSEVLRRTGAPDAPDGSRGDLTLRFEGRIVYDRPTGMSDRCTGPTGYTEEGVDYIWFQVMDQDDDWDDEIRSGRTNPDGTFDTGWFTWDDDGDTPDIYLRYECDTGVVNVQDPEHVLEAEYSWSNIDDYISDWDGRHYDFGTHKPGNSALMPALHIHNSITRGHRFLTSRGIATLPEVDVLWPSGDNASYSTFYQEIKISSFRQWNDGTHLHEYGHHFTYHEAAHIDVDYCNGFCDGEDCPECGGVGCPGADPDDCPNPGHCAGCPENLNDAWHEGFPNWFSDVIGRSWAEDYTLSDGSEWVVLEDCDKNQESLTECCQDGLMHGGSDALITERFVGALLRDMEDETQDDHNTDRIRDSLCLGFDEIFHITMAPPQASDVEEFIILFMSVYPEHYLAFWKTAYNVSPAYAEAAQYPDDWADPEAVTWVDSPTHPLGVGGVMPCVTIEWLPPHDDTTGACDYAYKWDTDPTNYAVVPTVATDVDLTGCLPQVTVQFYDLGEYYFHVRAQDCALTGRRWGPSAVFGPFVIEDCNNNGILDVCEVACDASGLDVVPPCASGVPPSFCATIAGCGTAADCNGNIIPDDCDIASGFSNDCNLNAIPDECENMFNWDGPSGPWHSPSNWLEGTSPTAGSEVCIDVPGTPTVTYSNGALAVGTLACSESLSLIAGSPSPAELTLNNASWIDGDLGLTGLYTVLEVIDRLDIGGVFEFTGVGDTRGAKLTGPGVTYANGGLEINNVAYLENHTLILDGNSTSVCEGVLAFPGASRFEIRPGSTYEYQGDGGILSGWHDDVFVNEGTLIKSVDSGRSSVYTYTENSGLIHAKTGMLWFYLGGNSTGEFRGDPGTTLAFNGGHQFHPSSSIIADNVEFPQGGHTIQGTYDVTTATTNSASVLTFTEEANVVSYGSSFYIQQWTVNFNAIIGEPIRFDTLSVGPGASGTAFANFNSGEPVQVTNLILSRGTIQTPNSITITGLTTWNGGGHFDGAGTGTVNAEGDVLVNYSGDEKSLRYCTFNNTATATLLGGFNMPYGTVVFNNLATGVIDIQFDGGVISGLHQTLNNAGTMVKSAGAGTSTISAPTNNTGTVEVQTGVLEFYTHYDGHYVQTAGRTVLNGGDLNMFGPAPVYITGGLLTGAGAITGNVLNSSGTTAPGLSTGVLDIDGAYIQGINSALEIDIAGLNQGSEYDLLTVSGTANLAGNLEVNLPTNGFAPVPGDSFQILTAGSVVDEFDTVNVTNLSPYLNMEVVYTATDVTLDMVGVVPGDCNLDGDAALDDYGDLKACLLGPGGGTEPGCRCFDFDDNGDVDLVDFAEFQAAFTGS
ncbi:MAG: hypothetical protein JSU86_00210 [Phycisphaerales bacterium]|nr:MAG: hypothetical protein JSU86_00210 [Phycisphaerales bacterium]